MKQLFQAYETVVLGLEKVDSTLKALEISVSGLQP